jgi:superoxide dismutase, Fe-Mn family
MMLQGNPKNACAVPREPFFRGGRFDPPAPAPHVWRGARLSAPAQTPRRGVMSDIALPELPWAPEALEPTISRKTIDKHYGKHHRGYVEKANALIKGTGFEGLSHEDIILEAAKAQATRPLLNSAAQAWNHERYWESLSPEGGAPSDALAAQIDKDFRGLDKLKDEIVKKGVAHFASGWVWLGLAQGKLEIIDTHDSDTALQHGLAPLLVLDLWEHAYYLDYQNERERHLRAVIEDVLDWRGASERFAAHTA